MKNNARAGNSSPGFLDLLVVLESQRPCIAAADSVMRKGRVPWFNITDATRDDLDEGQPHWRVHSVFSRMVCDSEEPLDVRFLPRVSYSDA